MIVIETFLVPGAAAPASLARAACSLLVPSKIPCTVVGWFVSFLIGFVELQPLIEQ